MGQVAACALSARPAARRARCAPLGAANGVSVGVHQCPPGRPKGTMRPPGGQRTQGRRPKDSRRLVPRSGMRRSRTE